MPHVLEYVIFSLNRQLILFMDFPSSFHKYILFFICVIYRVTHIQMSLLVCTKKLNAIYYISLCSFCFRSQRLNKLCFGQITDVKLVTVKIVFLSTFC